MAKTYANPKQRARFTATGAAALYLDRQQFDLADPAADLAALAANDAIQIGVVPAGHVLVPHLSTLSVPKLDTGGSGAGEFSIGTAAGAASLLAATAATAAVSKGVGDLLNASIGSPDTDTPILLTCTTACTAQATTGVISGDWVFRAYDAAIDG